MSLRLSDVTGESGGGGGGDAGGGGGKEETHVKKETEGGLKEEDDKFQFLTPLEILKDASDIVQGLENCLSYDVFDYCHVIIKLRNELGDVLIKEDTP